jgi:predicted nuclease with TOPRIM domain
MKNRIIEIIITLVIAVVVSVLVTKSLTNLQIDMELQEAYGGLVNRINVLDQASDDAYQELNKLYQSLDAITYDESIDELASRTKDLEKFVLGLEAFVISLEDKVALLIRPLETTEPPLETPTVVEEVTEEPTKIIKDSWQEPTFLSCIDDRVSKPSTKSLVRALEKARSVGTFEFDVTYNVASDGNVNNVRVEDGVPTDIQRIATRYVGKFQYASADVGVNDCVYAMRLIVNN